MTQHIIPAATALALTACAAAQEWRIELSNPTLTPAAPSTDITISIYVTGEDYFHHAELATHAIETGWEEISFESLIIHPGQSPGELSPDGRSVLGQTFHRLYTLPPFPGPEPNPLPAWRGTFTATDFTPREIAITTETDLFEVYVETFPGLPPEIERRTPAEARAVIQVIPAPTSMALGAAALLAAVPRRRR